MVGMHSGTILLLSWAVAMTEQPPSIRELRTPIPPMPTSSRIHHGAFSLMDGPFCEGQHQLAGSIYPPRTGYHPRRGARTRRVSRHVQTPAPRSPVTRVQHRHRIQRRHPDGSHRPATAARGGWFAALSSFTVRPPRIVASTRVTRSSDWEGSFTGNLRRLLGGKSAARPNGWSYRV